MIDSLRERFCTNHQRAIWFIVGLTCFGVPLLLLAQHSAVAADTLDNAVVLLYRAFHFPKLAVSRFQTCSIPDAWVHATSADENKKKEQIAAQSRVLQVDKDLTQVDTPEGPFWIPSRDMPTLFEMIGEQERDDYGAGGRGVHAGDVVLDCGANAGVYTRHALRLGAKRVISIDPGPAAVRCLRRNFSAEIASGRVVIYPKGVWNKEDVLELTTNDTLASTANSVAINRGAHGPVVQLTTIDTMVDELKLDTVDFIKMDIEGAERQALQGGRNTIARFHPRMAIALEHRPSDAEDLAATVHGLWPRLTTEYGPCANLFGRIQPNVLFVH